MLKYLTGMRRRSFGFSAILVVVLVLLLVVVGAIGGAKYFGKTGVSFPQPTPKSTSVYPQPSSPPTPGSGVWETYVNNNLKFSIQYPNDKYFVSTTPLTGKDIVGDVFISVKPNDSFNRKQPLSLTYGIVIAAITNSRDLSFSNLNQQFGNGPLISYVKDKNTDVPIKEIYIGGEKALRVNDCCGGQFGVEANIYTIHNKRIYEILVGPEQISGDPLPNKQIYENILSTFKFLD